MAVILKQRGDLRQRQLAKNCRRFASALRATTVPKRQNP